ncbi:MAG: hypothetical protein ACOX8W_04805 [bacterium]
MKRTGRTVPASSATGLTGGWSFPVGFCIAGPGGNRESAVPREEMKVMMRRLAAVYGAEK